MLPASPREGIEVSRSGDLRGHRLVVTSDTSVAHLAGALGVPVFVVLQALPDWR